MTVTDPTASFGNGSLGEDDPRMRTPLVEGADQDFGAVTDAVASIPELPVERTNKIWIACFGVSVTLLGILGLLILHLITTGVGVWGNNNPAYWG
ncbi:MAG: hypothetical protein AAF726_20915, partial [Planctomycetota bacterium]